MNNVLIRFSSLFFLLFILVGEIKAQDKASMNLHFVYIDHEVTTPITELCGRLRSLQEDATEVDDALMIYLSDGRASLVSFTNMKDTSGQGRDKELAFVEIISALQDANSHDVIATEDIKNIIELFDEYNFVEDDGSIMYNSVSFDFYVGASFWTLGNNEKVISHLYHDFSMSELPKDKFNLNIYVPKTDHVSFPEGMPFGDNNIEGINDKLKLFEY